MGRSVSGPLIPPDAVSAEDYRRHAQARLSPEVWAWLEGAGADGLTRRWNREAFDAQALAPRILAEMEGAQTWLDFFGRSLPHPFLVAPMAHQRLAHPEGEAAMALGATAAGAAMVVSCQASRSFAGIARAAPGADLWLQLYLQPDRLASLDLAQRAAEAGFRGVLLTADAPVNGLRNEEARAGFRLPPEAASANLAGPLHAPSRAGPGESPVFKGMLDAAPTWRDLEALRSRIGLPLLVKGILHPADARRALDCGADGLVVSNHGGRVLDTAPASLAALPYVAAEVKGAVPILLDGGVRRGTDALKALALGATAVMVGRPMLHALTVGGASGVAHLLTILRAELETAMTLTGRRSLAEIDAGVLWPPKA